MRLHFEIKHEIVLDETGFNLGTDYDNINRLVEDNCLCGISPYDESFCVTVADFKDLICYLKDTDDKQFNEEYTELKGERKNLIDAFQDILNSADKRDGYIHLAWY